MQVIILKDGTVPVALAKVLHTDGLDARYREELSLTGAHNYVETFDLPDDSAAAFVTWQDGEGFNVTGYPVVQEALDALFAFDGDVEPGMAHLVNYGHWSLTYGFGDDESYGHVFTL